MTHSWLLDNGRSGYKGIVEQGWGIGREGCKYTPKIWQLISLFEIYPKDSAQVLKEKNQRNDNVNKS